MANFLALIINLLTCVQNAITLNIQKYNIVHCFTFNVSLEDYMIVHDVAVAINLIQVFVLWCYVSLENSILLCCSCYVVGEHISIKDERYNDISLHFIILLWLAIMLMKVVYPKWPYMTLWWTNIRYLFLCVSSKWMINYARHLI